MPRRVNPDRVARFRRLGTALALVLVSGAPVLQGSAAKRELALKYYQDAVAQRLDIETVPENKRTPELYQKAIQAFRRVYRTSPQSSKADDSLLAIADIYAQMGERFGAAPGVATYQAKAVEAYEFLIHEYPYSSLLDQARKKADSLKQQIADTPADKPAVVNTAAATEKPFPAPNAEPVADRPAERVTPRPEPPAAPAKPGLALSEIADVRHWSFPDFTRVVINLEAEPKVQAERLTEPDRIYFDLPNTKLGGDRKFRTLAVNDALVKRIRMAQTQASVTRVVIDLNADVQQSTSVLTNPTRLVVELRRSTGAPPAAASVRNSEPVLPARQSDQHEGSVANATEQPAAEAVKSLAKPGENKLGENRPVPAAATKSTQAKPADSTVTAGITPKLPPSASLPAAVEAAAAKHPAASTPARSTAAVAAKAANSPMLPPADSDNLAAAISPKPAKSISSGNSGSESNADPRSAEGPEIPLPQRAASTKSSGSKRAAAPAAVPATKVPPSVTDAATVEPALTAAVTAEPKPVLPSAAAPAAPKSVRPKTVDTSKASSSPKPGESSTEVASLPRLAAPKAADPTSRGERDLVRALGLKISRVVIDAGHGGHDTGTIGPTGLLEKDLTLDVATRLGDLIADRIGSEIVYTRSDDTFIPLGERTAMANEKGADLFISVHANSSRVRAVRGIETYYLNLTGDRDALATAARENASSEKTIHELQDLVSKITLTEKISESREFASQVQRSLFTAVARENATLRNRGVRTAPFVVLIGARMPSVLAEISFISNPRDEKLLKTPAYRQKIAEALYKGVAGYAGGLSSVEVAKK